MLRTQCFFDDFRKLQNFVVSTVCNIDVSVRSSNCWDETRMATKPFSSSIVPKRPCTSQKISNVIGIKRTLQTCALVSLSGSLSYAGADAVAQSMELVSRPGSGYETPGQILLHTPEEVQTLLDVG